MVVAAAAYNGLLSAVLLLSTPPNVSSSSVNDPPAEKTVAVVGQEIHLSCATDFPSNCTKWIFTATGTKKEINVYSKEKGINRNFTRIVVTSLSSGGCTLKINDVQLDDAGNYECFVIGRNETSLGITSSNLTVIDKRPNCSGNFEHQVNEGHEIELKCEVRFKGDWIPKTQWKRKTIHGLEKIVSEDEQTLALTNTSVVSILKFKAKFTLNGSSYTYETFILQNVGNEATKELDKVTGNWTSPTLNVFYGVKSILVYRVDNGTTNKAHMFCVGNKLECSADANPSPSYEWVDESGSIRVSGEILDLRPNMTNLTLMCTANNSISKHTSQSFRVMESCSYGENDTPNLTAAFVVFAAISVALIMLMLCLKICWKKGEFHGLSLGKLHHRSIEIRVNQLQRNDDEHSVSSIDAAVGNSYMLINTEPLYAQVRKEAISTHSKKFYVAADGTEYMDINYSPTANQTQTTSGKQHISPATQHQTCGNMERLVHENTTYAMIDHTLKAPPPRSNHWN